MDSTDLLNQAIAILKRAEALLESIEQKMVQPHREESRSVWIDKHQAATIVHRDWKTLARWRADTTKGLIAGVHWQHDGGVVVYHREMLTDWYNCRSNPEVHLNNIIQKSRSATPAKRRGRPCKESA